MPRYIMHDDGLFFEWSTVVDAPVSHAVHREEFVANYLRLEGEEKRHELEERLERAVAKGCSSRDPADTLETVMAYNRAGPREGCMKVANILKMVKDPKSKF